MKTFLLLLIATTAMAGPLAELPQAGLIRTERVNPWAVSYDNSLFIDPLQPGYLGDDTKRTFRCGEVVRIVGTDRIAIVFDYRWDGHQWLYKVRGARYNINQPQLRPAQHDQN